MQIQRKCNVWVDIVVINIVGEFVGVHNWSWNLDSPCEVEVEVAKVVSGCLDLFFVQFSGVECNFEVDRQRCCHCGLVRDHKEVEELRPITFHKSSVQNCPRLRVEVLSSSVSVRLLKQPVRNIFVNKNIEDLRVIVWLEVLEGINYVLKLESQALLLQGCPPNSVPIYHNLSWKISFVVLSVIFERL